MVATNLEALVKLEDQVAVVLDLNQPMLLQLVAQLLKDNNQEIQEI